MKISLQKISIFNFRSFEGEHFLEFPKNGLVSVSGSYKIDPSLSNGSGKTSLIMAINHLLLINELSSTELQNWYSEKPYKIEGFFSVDEEILIITRSPGLFKINFKNKELSGEEAKDYTKQIFLNSDLLELITYRRQQSEGVFLPLSASERYSLLFQITDLNKIEKIIEKSKSVISLKEKELVDKKQNLKINEEKRNLFQGQIERINEQVLELNRKSIFLSSKLSSLKEPQEDPYNINLIYLNKELETFLTKEPQENSFTDEKLLNEISEEFDDAVNTLLFDVNEEFTKRTSLLTEEHEKTNLNIKVFKDEFETKDDLIRNKQAKILENDLVVASFKLDFNPTEMISQYEQATKRKKFVNSKLSSILTSICPECKSEIEEENVNSLKNDYLKELNLLDLVIKKYEDNKTEINNCLKFENENMILNREIESLNKEQSEKENNIRELQNKDNIILEKLNSCKNVVELEFHSLKEKKEGRLNLIKNKEASAKERFKNDFLIAKSKWENELNKINNNIEKQRNKNKENFLNEKNKYENEKIELETKISSIKSESERAFSSMEILKKELDFIIKNISDTIIDINKFQSEINIENEIIKSLGRSGFAGSYISDIILYLTDLINENLNSMPIMTKFSVVIENEKILKNQNTKPDINIKIFNGNNEVSYKSLSGGQKQSINWAIDQAIDRLISEKYDKFFSWKILDEPFSALDLSSKQAAIEMLSKFSKEKLVLITDHSKFLNDNLDSEIKIKFDSNKSYFEN